jgi:glycosyltransferase involved in cell wall biosynthesis
MSATANGGTGPQSRPEVSVIVPARNEEACLGACLESLVGQTGVTKELIVVDDGSTDRTREIARNFAGVCVMDAGERKDGWGGKSNAVWSGAQQAGGRWLLFTDADTVHAPGSLASALREAEEHRAALLSYSPAQEVHGFWERAVMPVVFAELADTYRPADVCDPASACAAANGQYLLVERAAYFAIGGHAAVAKSLLEDVELARLVKQSGRRIRFRMAAEAVRTRMYRSFAQLCEGWTKNLALLFPSTVTLALLRLAEFLLLVATAAVAAFELVRGHVAAAALLAVVAALFYSLFLARIRKAHFGALSDLFALFGLPIFVTLLLRSHIHYKVRRSVTWKGREYEVKPAVERS